MKSTGDSSKFCHESDFLHQRIKRHPMIFHPTYIIKLKSIIYIHPRGKKCDKKRKDDEVDVMGVHIMCDYLRKLSWQREGRGY